MPMAKRRSGLAPDASARRMQSNHATGHSCGRFRRLHLRSRRHAYQHDAAPLSRVGLRHAPSRTGGVVERGFVLFARRRADGAGGRVAGGALRIAAQSARSGDHEGADVPGEAGCGGAHQAGRGVRPPGGAHASHGHRHRRAAGGRVARAEGGGVAGAF